MQVSVIQSLYNLSTQTTLQYFQNSQKAFIPSNAEVLLRQSERILAGLYKIEVRRNSKVLLLLDWHEDFFSLYIALQQLGATIVLYDKNIQDSELREIIDFCKIDTCFTDSRQTVTILENLRVSLPGLERVVSLDPQDYDETYAGSLELWPFKEVIRFGIQALEHEPTLLHTLTQSNSLQDLVQFVYTRGTTTDARAAQITAANLAAQVSLLSAQKAKKNKGIRLSTLKTWDQLEILLSLSDFLNNQPRATLAAQDFSNPSKWKTSPVASLSGTNSDWQALYSYMQKEIESKGPLEKRFIHWGLSSNLKASSLAEKFQEKKAYIILYCLISLVKIASWPFGAKKIKNLLSSQLQEGLCVWSPLPSEIYKFFRSLGITIKNIYYSAEAGAFIWGNAELPAAMEFQIRDREGKMVSEGCPGELFIRGPQLMQAYYRQPLKTREVLDRDGWLQTGDRARLVLLPNKKLELELLGRQADYFYLLNGEIINSVQLEQGFAEKELIQEAFVFGQGNREPLVILVPHFDNLKNLINSHKISTLSPSALCREPTILAEYARLVKEVALETGCTNLEHFALVPRPFVRGREKNTEGELCREALQLRFHEEIENLTK